MNYSKKIFFCILAFFVNLPVYANAIYSFESSYTQKDWANRTILRKAAQAQISLSMTYTPSFALDPYNPSFHGTEIFSDTFLRFDKCLFSLNDVQENCASLTFWGYLEMGQVRHTGVFVTSVSGQKWGATFAPNALTTVGTKSLYDGSLPPEYQGRLSFYVGGIPEPVSWVTMIGGFGIIGGLMRHRRSKRKTYFLRN